ncbi:MULTISPECIES: hypothetical protein [Heyndrickxia]|uniref:hypothetical protein n=1 Tax=Heyndrickxia TaxID=2837504 RepID=UPI001B21B4F0|nr:hypothetical protein [Heyndrickxia oleronia]GIN38488.1 hypothetical protein J19TS1_14370 [Heyndrickxia oleronia]
MPIKVVPISSGFPSLPPEKNDCIALRMYGKDALSIEISFPFHEDTPNFSLSISEAMDLKNAIDQLLDIRMLEKPRGK